jgi:hypothetical protein
MRKIFDAISNSRSSAPRQLPAVIQQPVNSGPNEFPDGSASGFTGSIKIAAAIYRGNDDPRAWIRDRLDRNERANAIKRDDSFAGRGE